MTTVEQYYQEIGLAVVELATGATGRIALFSQAEDGHISASMFYIETNNPRLRCIYPPESVLMKVYAFWEEWGRDEENKTWVTMCLIIDGDDFTIDFLYPDDFTSGFPSREDEVRLLDHYFGSSDVDRSNPGGGY